MGIELDVELVKRDVLVGALASKPKHDVIKESDAVTMECLDQAAQVFIRRRPRVTIRASQFQIWCKEMRGSVAPFALEESVRRR